MRHFLLIAIFSCAGCLPSWAQSTGWYYGQDPGLPNSQAKWIYFVRNPGSIYFSPGMSLYNVTNTSTAITTVQLNWSVFDSGPNSRAMGMTGRASGTYFWSGDGDQIPRSLDFTWNGTNVAKVQPTPTPTPTPVPFEEYDFELTFGAEYGGSVVTLYAADGTVLASYTIPVGGTVLEGGVSAPSLEGAYWDVDGIFAGSIDDPTAAPNTSTARPGYDFGFAPSFEGGEWKAERGDGLVVGGGSIVPGTSDVGRVTVGQGDEVTVWTRVPAGDGMGSAWVPTPVSLPSANTTTSYFFTSSSSPTNAPAPVPTPTPVPIPTPAPAPGVATTNVTTNNLAADEVVTLDVPDAEVPDPDFGAVELVEEAQGVFGKVAEGYENFAEAFTTGALTFNAFKNLYLPPPGLNCTFEMGPVSINLSSMLPAWVRGGSKIVFLLAALGAMMRMLWEAFA